LLGALEPRLDFLELGHLSNYKAYTLYPDPAPQAENVVSYEFRRGRSAETIFESYPSIGSLSKVYGVIAFILDHPTEVEAYLKARDHVFEQIKAEHPEPSEMIERFEQAKKKTSAKPI